MQVSGLTRNGAEAVAPGPDTAITGRTDAVGARRTSKRVARIRRPARQTIGGGETAYADGNEGAPTGDGTTDARDASYLLRDALRPVSGLQRLIDCGMTALAGGVVPVIRKGRAGYAGLVTCGSVHVCPCCSTTIRRVRQEELDQVGQFWECQSCGLVMMTLTMRHYRWQALAVLAEQQRVAWREGFGQNAGRSWRKAKVTFGIRGFVRAWEVTHGANGWHCHYHVLLFLDRPLATARVEKLQRVAFQVWATALKKAGGYLPVEKGQDGKPVGVKIDAPDRGEAGQMARYLMKGQDGKTRWGVAAELTRLDIKTGTDGHRTPFEIARAAVAEDANPRDIALWQEFERTATGIRSLYWSNGLRKLLREMGFELDDRNDGDLAAEEAAAGERLAMIPAATWYRHIARHKGRSLALLHAAERGGVAAIRALIESWGLIWGADIHPAEELPPNSALPTADEVLRRQERVNLAQRAHVWRRAFEADELAEKRNRADVVLRNEQLQKFAADRDRGGKAKLPDTVALPDDWAARVAANRAAAAEQEITEMPALGPLQPLLNTAQERFLEARRRANAVRITDREAALQRARERDGVGLGPDDSRPQTLRGRGW